MSTVGRARRAASDEALRAAFVRKPTPGLREWLFEVDERSLAQPGRSLLIVARIGWLVVRGLLRDRIHLRAASLSFHTLLAIVPALAVAFAVGKAIGLHDQLLDSTIRPFLDTVLGPPGQAPSEGVAELRQTVDAVIQLVEHTSLTGLGIAGLAVLVLTLVRVVRGAEEAFGAIFDARRPTRSLLRRVRALLVTLAVTPLGLVYAVTATYAAHWLETVISIAVVREVVLFFLPPALTTLAILVMYVELPDLEVRKGPAVVGALVAGLVWYGLQLLHIRFQVGLARWNAIYSGFGAFPVLLANIHASWLLVLVGAQIVAALQNAPSLRVLSRSARRRDQLELQKLSLHVVMALVDLDHPATPYEIAKLVDADVPSVESVLDALVEHRVVQAVLARGRGLYALAIDPATLRALDVVEAVDRSSGGPMFPNEEHDEVSEILRARREAAERSVRNVTIVELMRRRRPSDDGAREARETSAHR